MTRAVARLIWWSTLVVPLLFGWVVEAIRGDSAHLDRSSLVFWLSVLVSALCIALAQVAPRRLRMQPTGRVATAFLRLLSGWALCETAAFFPLLAWIVTDDPRLLGVCAVDLLALLTLYPSEARWTSLLPGAASPSRR